jgi:hypothetical protein
MNRENIIRLAREAGIANSWDLNWQDKIIERFAALVASAEREACAALCFEMWEKWMDADPSERDYLSRDADDCAAAIRARGQE